MKGYKYLISEIESKKIKEVKELIKTFGIFKDVDSEFLEQFFYLFKPKTFNKGEFIYKEGDPVDGAYFSTNGHFRLLKSVSKGIEDKFAKLENDIKLLKLRGKILMHCNIQNISEESCIKKNNIKNVITEYNEPEKIISNIHPNKIEV